VVAEAEPQAEAEALTEEQLREKKLEEERRTREERGKVLDALRVELNGLEESIRIDQGVIDEEAKLRANSAEVVLLLSEKMEGLKKVYSQHKKTLDLLPDAKNNAKKLQEIIDGNIQKYEKLRAEWESHREPLEGELGLLKDKRNVRGRRIKDKLDEMRRLKGDINDMADSIREKVSLSYYLTQLTQTLTLLTQLLLPRSAQEARSLKLKAEYDKMPKNINRSIYTYRIMDIINSITKQKMEIKRVVADIRDVQKAINSTSDTLLRTEAIADESLFQAAKAGEGGGGGGGGCSGKRGGGGPGGRPTRGGGGGGGGGGGEGALTAVLIEARVTR